MPAALWWVSIAPTSTAASGPRGGVVVVVVVRLAVIAARLLTAATVAITAGEAWVVVTAGAGGWGSGS